jgi:hypothetical protein
MDIHSRPGQGTRVCVRLPLDCERALAGEHRAAQEQSTIASLMPGQATTKNVPRPTRSLPPVEMLALIDGRVKKSA